MKSFETIGLQKKPANSNRPETRHATLRDGKNSR